MTPAKNEHEVDTEAFKGLHFKIITKCRETGAMQLAAILDLIKKGKRKRYKNCKTGLR